MRVVESRPRVVPVWSRGRYVHRVLVHGVVSAETERAVDTFVRREDAERFLENVRADEDLATALRLEPIELDA